MDNIGDAVEVRGVLEGMAARLVAEAGLMAEVRTELEAAVQAGRALVEQALHAESQAVDAQAWRKVNQRFHDVLIQACGNSALVSALEHNNKMPFVGPGSLALATVPTRLATSFVTRAQTDHEDVLQALVRGEASRAESLMREHAYRSRDNKRLLIQEMRSAREKKGDSPALGPADLLVNSISA